MKRVLISVLVLLLIVVVGCSDGTLEIPVGRQNGDSNLASPSETEAGTIRYLASFPVDVLPLFEVTNVISSQFSVRHSLNYVIGKDYYHISFESAADRDAISEYYRELLDEIDVESSFDDYTFAGYIDQRRVSVSIYDWEYEHSLGVPVQISIGEHPERYADHNRYYDTYPDDLIEIYEANTEPEYQYTEDYTSNYVRYFTSYFTQAGQDDVLDFYRNMYSDKENFSETEDEYAIRMRWNDGVYRCTMQFQTQESFLGNGVAFTVDRDLEIND